MLEEANRISLYVTGQPSKSAFIVHDSNIYIESEYFPRIKIELDNLPLGVLELFLAHGSHIPPRFFVLTVSASADIRLVDFETVLGMGRQYEFGFSTNRFMAILIDQTNTLLRSMFTALGDAWPTYQKRAILYGELVTQLAVAAKNLGITDYQRLAAHSAAKALYQDGVRFMRQRSLARVAFSPGAESGAEMFMTEQMICRSGDSADCIFILLKGQVIVSKGGSILATIAEPGVCFGELAFLVGGKRTADIIASEKSAILRVSKSALRSFHSTHPEMFLQVARTLASRVVDNFENLRRYNAKDAINSQAAKWHSSPLQKREFSSKMIGAAPRSVDPEENLLTRSYNRTAATLFKANEVVTTTANGELATR